MGVSRRSPCPCGSGKRYKFYLGADAGPEPPFGNEFANRRSNRFRPRADGLRATGLRSRANRRSISRRHETEHQ
jgi:hypothetical protein